jgi:chromosome segregation ATPase
MKLTILGLSTALAFSGCSDTQTREEFAAELSALRNDIKLEIAALKDEVSEAKDLRRDMETETFVMRMEEQRVLANQQKKILDRLSDLEMRLNEVDALNAKAPKWWQR